MDLSNLLEMQVMLVLLMALGLFLSEIGMIDAAGRTLLTNLVINVLLPCSIVKSFLIDFDMETLRSCLTIFVIAILIQIGTLLLGKILYPRYADRRKKVLQYATICSNAGILGNPVAEAAFGSMGLLYASIYLIPQRTFMWSFGLTYYTECPSGKELAKKVATHPCIIAAVLGLVLMITQWQLPGFVESTVESLGSANTPISMLLIGSILSGVKWREMIDRDSLYYCFVRLILVPALVFLGCRLVGVEGLVMGVSVLLAAMPAASVTAVLAAKYEKDEAFAARIVALSTILSMATAPLWCVILTL
ncbi:MAG: AEC family transporter [Lachnospiraceae bacterium]|nr:AEC family transporter [Lachnospiraceae bacterium]